MAWARPSPSHWRARGAQVAITARGADTLEAAAGEIREAGGTALPIPVDLTGRVGRGAPRSIGRRASSARSTSSWSNVGGSSGERTSAAGDEDWDAVMTLNFRVAVRLCRQISPSMIERGAGEHSHDLVDLRSRVGRGGLLQCGQGRAHRVHEVALARADPTRGCA